MGDSFIFSNKNAPVQEAVQCFLSSINPDSQLYLAFSGGLDSSVLLHALAGQRQAKHGYVSLTAIYVNHGIQKDSLAWREHCREVCSSLQVEFISIDIELGSYSREGLESKARKLRYQAFESIIKKASKPDSYLLTGHHQRDQAETFLLNLFRGSGVNGLAAMPKVKMVQSGDVFKYQHIRPLLNIPYRCLQDYAEYYQLRHVVDESNAEIRFRRNYVRHKLLPEIESTWPIAQSTLASTAIHMQEASKLLDKLAGNSLKQLKFSSCFIELVDIEELEWVEQKNIIRFWLKRYWPGVVLNSAHYEWILDAFLNFTSSQNQNYGYQLSKGELRLYKTRLYYLANMPKPFEKECELASIGLEGVADVDSERQDVVEAYSELFVFKNSGLCSFSKVKLRSIKADDQVNRKQLKKFFQSNDIPVWEREFWPVIELADKTVFVLGCERCADGDAGGLKLESLQKDAVLDKTEQVGLSYWQRMKLMGIL
ncbi:tRNA(Ile)-lysidine synthase [Thiomicrorhabdus immobilis]|uniref:tRNA(Ile)-lysidine synthase n=1 Tax=Thiomicrorhabdus immobilis TaxID=2791037 RepID=A0ABN6CXH8_9GAMM|nr:tRNA lysidine(34) synthetase TilS [Thiomicrorhabdus immobilis]BCN93419.1 tRNA(Ile)-lysidine synthase [Thiomicrorhabdus immobilis]